MIFNTIIQIKLSRQVRGFYALLLIWDSFILRNKPEKSNFSITFFRV